MFFELRQYRVKDGKREEWVRMMEEEIIPFQISQGMVVIGSFVGEQEDDLYVWIRRFEDEEDRKIPASRDFDGTRVPKLTYVWEQAAFNPVNHDILCHIHFDFKDGTRMEKAFTYDWRLWSLMEIKEVMIEAGFAVADVYCDGWDEDGDEPDEVFVKRTELEEMDAWVAYVVGLK